MPVAVTEKVAVWPAVTVCAAGCMVMTGATTTGNTTAAVTVSVALLLVTEPALLLTLTEYIAPLSALLVAGVV